MKLKRIKKHFNQDKMRRANVSKRHNYTWINMSIQKNQ